MPNSNTKTPRTCECHAPIANGPVPGVLWPWGTASDTSRPWVEACDVCKAFADDNAAAAALATAFKTTVAWAHPAGLDTLHPFVDIPKPESTKIYVVAPTDDSHELAAFTEEQDADHFAETFVGAGVEEVILCSGALARRMTTERRESQYDEIGETPVNEVDISQEELGRWVVSCGPAEDGRRGHLHVVGDDEDEVLSRAADQVEGGWIPVEIHDLNTGDARQLEITTAVRPVG